MRRLVAVSVMMVLALVASACRGGDDEGASTTSMPRGGAATSLLVSPDTVSDDPADDQPTSIADRALTTPTTQLVGGTPSYEVVERVEGDNGDGLVVVVEPGSYTEVELQNLVFDIVDRFRPLTVVVLDDPAAAALVSAEDLSESDKEFLASRTFLTVSDGVEVTFSGPYSEIADLTIGS